MSLKTVALVGICCACAGPAAEAGRGQVVAAPAAASESPAPARARAPAGAAFSGPVQVATTRGDRILRGDWEAPAALLIAYQAQWHDSLSQILAAAAPETRVFVLANSHELSDPGLREWLHSQAASVIGVEHDTAWIRDYGPLQIHGEQGAYRWLDLGYYAERPLDDAVPLQLSRLTRVAIESYPVVAEGGGIVSNGAGVCAMTDRSFQRALDYDVTASSTDGLLALLGCQTLAVVPALTGEETGHVDVIAQFLGPGLVVVSDTDAELHPEIAWQLDEAAQAIAEAARIAEQPMRVVRLPMQVDEGAFFSYVNGTRLSAVYLVPQYDAVETELERTAYARLAQALGDTRLAPVYADPMVYKGGAVHCLTLGLGAFLDETPAWPNPGHPHPLDI